FFASTFWGFDTWKTLSVIPPNEAADFMSYGQKRGFQRWASDYTWKGLFDEIRPLGGARLQALGTTQASAALTQSTDILVLGGAIIPMLNVASFAYTYRLSQDTISARKMQELQSSMHSINSAAAPYALELVDTNGAALFSQPFDTMGSFEGSTEQLFFLTV